MVMGVRTGLYLGIAGSICDGSAFMRRKNNHVSQPNSFPHRVACGLVLGLFIGLLPKDSALCYLVALIALLSPISIWAVIVSAASFSFLGPLLDTWTDAVGFWLLSQPLLLPVWNWLESVPAIAWFRLNNTVVVGSFGLAGLASLPVYILGGITFRRIALLWDASSNSASPVSQLATELDG